jgi:DAK2 domain fusion protein YloV
VTKNINKEKFKEMIIYTSNILELRQEEINALNVFPVPDGDTGTNMCITLMAGCEALQNSYPKTVGRAVEITADAMLRVARGNSGVILALFFRGMAKRLKECTEADAHSFADALLEGVGAAYKSIINPVEGTILTVSRFAAAEAVRVAANESDIEIVLRRATEAGYNELDKTIEANPVLKNAGVVDAGAKCYLYLLEGMLAVLSGDCNKKPNEIEKTTGNNQVYAQNAEIAFAYCTEFFAEKRNKVDLSPLRAFLGKNGDSLIIVEDEKIIKVHIHTNNPDAVLSEASSYVKQLTSKIENMREQHTHKYVTVAK